MNPLMNSVGSNAEGKLNCINAVVITHQKIRSAYAGRIFLCEEKSQPTDLSVGCGSVSGAISKTKRRGFASSPEKNKKHPGGVFFYGITPRKT